MLKPRIKNREGGRIKNCLFFIKKSNQIQRSIEFKKLNKNAKPRIGNREEQKLFFFLHQESLISCREVVCIYEFE